MVILRSWLHVDDYSHFSIYNIPFGIISTASNGTPRVALAIGTYVLDLADFVRGNGFSALSTIQPHQNVFSKPTLNNFAALGRPLHRVVREYLQSVLLQDGPFPDILENNQELRQSCLIPLQQVQAHLPMQIGDYTDFYAGLHHAYNVGVLFRGPENALQPNYMHLPVGYHGRASSVVVSGTPVRRPNGQILHDPAAATKQPMLAPSKKLDIELELGCFVCKPNALGQPISINEAPEHLFGLVLMNDWSARDIQAWEYVPLGPFNGKNFATTISAWVVLMDALDPFMSTGIQDEQPVLPYLDENQRKSHPDISLTVSLTPDSTGKASTIARTNAKNLLFSFPQMLAHHTIGGCPFNVGDLMGSGTISGTSDSEKGSLLEQTDNGKRVIALDEGVQRTFLEDGDEVSLSGFCGQPGALVGFGECTGRIETAHRLQFG
ncbi:Fumarylacetoacetase [Polychaeton citri CBS 116435]|uniref:Fumarylacetoacetase n=1 Tax=Polychaeton citri CBS 116435 TaxID=1314669 RepID=A0A9P4PZD1_9PEZI|nr:Fumarylacetoacetase [Polychaeton citri CBS 116435]